MDLKDTCKVLLSKGSKQKVKCSIFYNKELERELAVHEDVDNKKRSSVTDVITGLRMFGLDKPADKVKMEELNERLDIFLKHFTVEETKKEFKRLETDEK